MSTSSQPTPRVRRPRKKMELIIRFRIRYSQKDDVAPRNLQIRLTIDGVKASDYGSGVTVRPAKWNQKDQLVMGRDKLAAELNERLASIELQHRDILRELKRRYAKGDSPRPTAELVKLEFQRPGSSSPTLLSFYNDYLNYLDSLSGVEDERAEKTLHRAYTVRADIRQFAGMDRFNPGDADKTPLLTDIVTGWGKRFHAWLQTYPLDSNSTRAGKHRMNKDSANKYLSHVRDCLNHAIDEGYLSHNVLDKYRPKRGKGREVYFLEPAQVETLMNLHYAGELADALWWCQLMCMTGLDYKDAVRYARDRESYDRRGIGGAKIVITRSKPPCNVCEIPLRYQVTDLFAIYPTGPPKNYTLPEINKLCRGTIGPAVGSLKPFTTKIHRKTAGAEFLRLGATMEGVSKYLGHSSVRTTETYYVKIKSSFVDSEMVRISERLTGTTKHIEKVVPILKVV